MGLEMGQYPPLIILKCWECWIVLVLYRQQYIECYHNQESKDERENMMKRMRMTMTESCVGSHGVDA